MTAPGPIAGREPSLPIAAPTAPVEAWERELCQSLACLPLLVWRQLAGGCRRVWRGSGSPAAGSSEESEEAWLERIHPADRAGVQERQAAGGEWEAELRMRRADGGWSWVLERAAPLYGDTGEPIGQVGMCFEIQARKAQEQELAHRAEHDPLTGLCNRQIFVEHLRRALARNVRKERHLALIFVDLDGFKGINDTHGHALGDELLIAVSKLLERLVRPQDVVTRLGGDEFVILIDEVQAPEEGLAIADRLVSEFARPFETSAGPVAISASCGLSLAAPGSELDPAELLERADEAMYLAKRRGKARTALYDAEFASEAARRRRLEGDLEAALAEHQLLAHYQPIVSLDPAVGARSRTLGFEVLLRWRHPELGLLCASDFLEAVVRGRRLAELERRVLPAVLGQLARWREQGHEPRLHFNLSPQQLHSERFVHELAAHLQGLGLSGRQLGFELPENLLTRDYAAASDAMRRLADLGASIWIDDFGTGHTSIGRLVHLPLTGLKVHRSFAVRLSNDPAAAAVLRGAVGLAQALGLRVVAQGVESEAVAEQLLRLGCREAQGFLFAEALPIEGAARWLPAR
jgi:diguanylate cyclase (GGDEF)-like protein